AGTVGVAYLLAREGTISNWWLLVIALAVGLAMPLAAKRLVPAAEPEGVAEPLAAGPLPLELVGVERPFTEADRVMLDAALGLPGEEAGAGAGRR
ncbi:MAG TPA: hypothetical protein VE395_01080, partial [Acidimicrobiales bacterium]|nr:hypothetical protein [Acidimicrobiales bacterium]